MVESQWNPDYTFCPHDNKDHRFVSLTTEQTIIACCGDCIPDAYAELRRRHGDVSEDA